MKGKIAYALKVGELFLMQSWSYRNYMNRVGVSFMAIKCKKNSIKFINFDTPSSSLLFFDAKCVIFDKLTLFIFSYNHVLNIYPSLTLSLIFSSHLLENMKIHFNRINELMKK